MSQHPDIAIQLIAFGGSGSDPGTANREIARFARDRVAGRMVFAEPEVGEELVRQLGLSDASLEDFVYRVPDPPGRRSYLSTETLDAFARWLQEDPERTTKGIVIVGDVNTASTAEAGLMSAEQRGLRRWLTSLLRIPGVQQVAAVIGIQSGVPKYKGLHWAARQMAQMMKAANITSVELIGQTHHLRDYSGGWLEKEYRRFSIEATNRSDQGLHADQLRVWDSSSNQQWVHSEEDWKGMRLLEARAAAFVVPRVHAIAFPLSMVPTVSTSAEPSFDR